MTNRTPVAEAFVFLASKLSRAVRIKERVAAQGGDIDNALGNVQEIENEASACFILARTPDGMERGR